MKDFFKRALLIEGPIWHRTYLAVFYLLLIDYLVLFWTFFSLPPGPATVMSDRMDRALMGPALMLFLLNVIAILAWIASGLTVAVKAIRRTLTEAWGVAYAILPIAGFFLLSAVYNAFLTGKGRAIHEFLYHLPNKL